MKKLLHVFVLSLLTTLLSAQVSKTIHVETAGTLSTLLEAEEKTSITNLIVTGNIDATDVKCMRDEITKLADLDISAVNIKEYNGNAGTYTHTTYPENEMPAYSFFNNYTNARKKTLITILLPTSITSIGRYAFHYCESIKRIEIPSSVNKIRDAAFSFCRSLTSASLPSTVTKIEQFAFNYCDKLTDLTLSESLTTIGYGAFSNCKSIKAIYSLNTTPPILDSNSFSGVNSVTAVYVPSSAVSAYKAAPGWSCTSSN